MATEKKETKSRKKTKNAERLVHDLSVAITGARPGDTLRGCTSRTRDVVLQLAPNSGIIGPLRVCVEAVKQQPDEWKRLMTLLVPLFPDLGDAERSEDWLLKNQVDGDKDFADRKEPVILEILSTGSNVKCKLNEPGNVDEQALNKLLDKEQTPEITAMAFRNVFVRKEGSGSKRQTLFLRPYEWRRETSFRVVTEYGGQSFDLFSDASTVRITNGVRQVAKYQQSQIYVFRLGGDDDLEVGVHVAAGPSASLAKILDVLRTVDFKSQQSAFDRVVATLTAYGKCWTPAYWKSLRQKLGRFQSPLIVFLDGYEAPTEMVIAVSTAMLIHHPGALLPDLGIFSR
jgi:hypothetical protein